MQQQGLARSCHQLCSPLAVWLATLVASAAVVGVLLVRLQAAAQHSMDSQQQRASLAASTSSRVSSSRRLACSAAAAAQELWVRLPLLVRTGSAVVCRVWACLRQLGWFSGKRACQVQQQQQQEED
jgi:hypothetical protein